MDQKLELFRKIRSSKELKLITTECEQNPEIIQFFSFPDFDIENSNFNFQPNIKALQHIFQKSNWKDYGISESDRIYHQQILYSKYCIYTYLKFCFDLKYRNLNTDIYFQLLRCFTKLINLSNKNVQSLVNETFYFLFLEFLKNSFDKLFFENFFLLLFDFLVSESHDIRIFSLIPEIFQKLIDEYGLQKDFLSAQFVSLIQIILVDKLLRSKNLNNQSNQKVENVTVKKIFNCCEPFFLQLNDYALSLLCNLPKHLDEDLINTFFIKCPNCFENYIESNERPFISIPPKNEFIQFDPIQSPSSLSQFYDIETFPNGLPFSAFKDIKLDQIRFFTSDKYNDHFHFKLTFSNNLNIDALSSNLLPFQGTEISSKIKIVSNTLYENIDKTSFITTIICSFCKLIESKKSSSKFFDYISLFVFTLTKLPQNSELEIPFPTSIIFDPGYEVTPELHLIRLLSIYSLLNFDLKSLEKVLKEVIKYPLIMTEITLIFVELGDFFYDTILKQSQKKFFRVLKDIGLLYQYEDLHGKTDRELIETPRIVLLAILEKEFQYKNLAEVIMKDTITIHFYLSHLFEINIQPFIMHLLSIYIGKFDVSLQFVQVLNQLFLQLAQMMHNVKCIKLITEILSLIFKSSKNLKSFKSLNDVICTILDKFDFNEISSLPFLWDLFNEVFTLLILYSMSNIKILPSVFNSIEKVVIGFSNLPNEAINFIENSDHDKNYALNIKLFEKLIQLLSGSFISNYEFIFNTVIINYDVLKILFHVYYDSKIINIFNFSYKFCCFSNSNCAECHNCGFDTLLLEYVQKNRKYFSNKRNEDNSKIDSSSIFLRKNEDLTSSEVISSNIYIALETVFEIMSISSSSSIVQQTISLFTPVDNHYITPLHPFLVKRIEKMLIEEKNSPNISISLVHSHEIEIEMENNFLFTCWIYIDSIAKAHILSVSYDETPILTIEIDSKLIYINKDFSYAQISKNKWSFLSVSLMFDYNNNNFSCNLFLESTLIKPVENLKIDNEIIKALLAKQSNTFKIEIGGKESNSGRIGNFAFYPLAYSNKLNLIYLEGPRLNGFDKDNLIPFYYADDSKLRELNLSSTDYFSEENTFSFILLNSFEIETFLPLFAQMDFPFINPELNELTFGAIDLANLLKASFAASNNRRNLDFDFAILSHILINSNIDHLTFELYKIFYSIYNEHLLLEDNDNNKFINCLKDNILLNFQLWYAARAQEHEKIISFIKEQKIINSISQLLIILRVYYWYEPLHKSTASASSLPSFQYNNYFCANPLIIEQGLPDTERQRDPNLNIKYCRKTLLSIFLPDDKKDNFCISLSMPSISLHEGDLITKNIKSNSISNLKSDVKLDIINEEEFVLILSHCILILNSHDPYQVYDLLEFLKHAKYSLISKEKLFLIHSILLNDLSDDTVIIMTIEVIIAIHKSIHFPDGFNISKHIEIIFSIISERPLSANSASFLESFIQLLNDCPDLFELCSFLSMKRKDTIFYHRINPSPLYCSRKTWAIWAVIHSMIIKSNNLMNDERKSEAESCFIYNFLIRCKQDEENWFSIFDSIRVASLIFKGLHFYDHRTLFLTVLGYCVSKNQSTIKYQCIESAFLLIVFSILFRKYSGSISKQLLKLYKESPFCTKDEEVYPIEKNNKIDFDDFSYPHQIIDVMKSQNSGKLKLAYTLGLKFDDDQQWVDISLAELALQISNKFNNDKYYKASFLIASFIKNASKGKPTEKAYHKFIKNWFDEMNFTANDIEANIEFYNFFTRILNESPAVMPDIESLYQMIEGQSVLKSIHAFYNYIKSQRVYNDKSLKESSSNSSLSSLTLSQQPMDEFLYETNENIHEFAKSIYLLPENGMKKWESLWSNMTVIGGAWNFSTKQGISNNIEVKSTDELTSIDNMKQMTTMDTSSTSINISDSKPKWKRSFIATSFYCPMRLKKNKHFDPHIEAAITREIGNYSDAQKIVRTYRGKIEDQYRQQNQKTLLTLSDEFDQVLNRSASVVSVLNSKNDDNNVKKSTSLPKVQENNENPNILFDNSENEISTSLFKESTGNNKISNDLISPQSSASSSYIKQKSPRNYPNIEINKEKKSKIKCELIKATKDILATFSIQEKESCILISPLSLLLPSTYISRTSATEKTIAKKYYRIPIKRITDILMRRRFQHPTAIEIYCIDGKSYFLNFQDKNTSMKVVDSIVKSIKYNAKSNILRHFQRNYDFVEFFQQQTFTDDWVKGKMSNFEYLIKLNIFGSRSFVDLSQYPVFPWVISKFDTKKLDLNDKSYFRDLTKPIGAIGEARLNELLERMEEMKIANQQMKLLMKGKSNSGNDFVPVGSSLMNLNDGFEEPYLYFSYVICPLAVFLYLIRMEPFTTLHIKMQSNKFDHGSRIFSSISESFNSASTSLHNYRELPPDFFFCPETLINENGFDLGLNKHGKIDDVDLPKWVHNNNAFEFVYLMRKAIESDFVSEFLSDWIDLMWGYKQKGEEAIKANNIYSSQLYDTVWDANQSAATNFQKVAEIEATLCHVGQVPPQLFTTKHPKREIVKEAPLFSNVSLFGFSQTRNKNGTEYNDEKIISSFISFEDSKKINILICSAFEHNESISTRKISFLIEDSKNVRFMKDVNLDSTCVKFFADESCYVLLNGKLIDPYSIDLQEKVSTAAFDNGYIAAVVENDSTVLLFGPELNDQLDINKVDKHRIKNKENSSLIGKPIKFYGEKVVCCDLSYQFKVVVCGTQTGHIFICSLFDSIKVNVLNLNTIIENDAKIGNGNDIFIPRKILISKSWGFIVCYAESASSSFNETGVKSPFKKTSRYSNLSASGNLIDIDEFYQMNSSSSSRHSIFIFTINGHFLRRLDVGFRITSLCTWMSRKAFDFLSIGTDDGRILACEIFDLNEKDFIDDKSENFNKWNKNCDFISLFGDTDGSKIVSCTQNKGTITAVTSDCKLVFAPLPYNFT